MERVFKIEAFRNMGFKDGKPCATELLLNESAEKGHLGNLLTVVGTNGAGKTNVLDALTTYMNEKFTEKDRTNLFYDSSLRNPSLKMEVNDEGFSYSHTKSYSSGTVIDFPEIKKNADVQKQREENLLPDLDLLCSLEDMFIIEKNSYRKIYKSSSFNDLRKQFYAEVQESLESVDEESKTQLKTASEEYTKTISSCSESFVSEAFRISKKISDGKYERENWYGSRKTGDYTEDEIMRLYNDQNEEYKMKRENAYRNYECMQQPCKN